MVKKFMIRVRPGVELVRAKFFLPTKELSKLDFPTFDLPTNAILGRGDPGNWSFRAALLRNLALRKPLYLEFAHLVNAGTIALVLWTQLGGFRFFEPLTARSL
jgi:hypothetical protein